MRTLEMRLARLRDRWPKDCLDSGKKRRNAVARRKTETAIARLSKELKGLPRWCFGGRRLLRQGRLREWRRRRDSEALFCGEAGRTGGNQVAQWSTDGTLQLRLPDACSRKCLVLRDVTFSREQQSLIEAAVDVRTPVTWRVKLLQRGKVQLCVTVEEPEPGVVSDSSAGSLGVDLNRDHVAVVRVSPRGRVAGAVRTVLNAGSDAVWKVARAVVSQAAEVGCPIVLENLDLRPKKAWLRSYGKRFAEILSIFRSRQVRDAVEREARRGGIEVRYVDPAWSTELGCLKYRRRCRLGGHHAAALVIGRRGLGFGERLPEDSPPALKCTVLECFSTSGETRALVQRQPGARSRGRRRRRLRRARAPGAPAAGARGL
jgi:IS605 OrfB family transposase